MNRHLATLAFAAGLAGVAWVARGYLGTNTLALALTVLIAALYLAGGRELLRMDRATAALRRALDSPQKDPAPALGPWLATLPAELRDSVRRRIEGDRSPLPGPAMTPYLVGLLVLVGMLGTFLGMVVALEGTVAALQSTTDLAAIRAALAAPVRGLGLGFGTSVDGVAASAMLGLAAALCRRERLQATAQLDALIATTLRAHTPAQQRQDALDALREQARLLPALVDRLDAVMGTLLQRAEQLDERLLARQEAFLRDTKAPIEQLAISVDRSLREALADGARAAGDAIRPAVDAALAGLSRHGMDTQQQLAQAMQAQLDALTVRTGAAVEAMQGAAAQSLAAQEARSVRLAADWQQALDSLGDRLDARGQAWLDRAETARTDAHAAQDAREQQRLQAWTAALEATVAALEARWQQQAAQASQLQRQMLDDVAQRHGELVARSRTESQALLDELRTLAEAAAGAPKAATELATQWRERLAQTAAQDDALLQERERVIGALAAVLDTLQDGVQRQREAMDALVASSTATLGDATARLGDAVQAGTRELAAVADQVSAGSAEVASLGEAMTAAVQQFSQTSTTLAEQLQRIETALAQSTARSDEQLAYYVAQAREIVDLSLASQRQIVEDMQRVASRQDALAGEAA